MDEKWGTAKRNGSKSYSKKRFNRSSSLSSNYSSPEDLAEYIIRTLSKEPDALEFQRIERSNWKSVISVTCDPNDLGRLIGKDGKMINAIRNLVNSASSRFGKTLEIEIKRPS